jgi:hypothetical protein
MRLCTNIKEPYSIPTTKTISDPNKTQRGKCFAVYEFLSEKTLAPSGIFCKENFYTQAKRGYKNWKNFCIF